MELVFEKIKNQKFEIGRTINIAKCDCKKCDYMNCPKNNYAVKMRIKKHTVDEFFETYKEDILRLNYHDKINGVLLRLNYFLINELVGDCISFNKGVYWGMGCCLVAKENIGESIYESVEIQRLSRNGNLVICGVISITDGHITDFYLNDNQYKCAEKISRAFKRVSELTQQEFEKQDTSNIGWLDRTGRLYKCNSGQHIALAEKLGSSELMLENQGWVKIFSDDKDHGFYCLKRKSAEQINRLIELGYMDNE